MLPFLPFSLLCRQSLWQFVRRSKVRPQRGWLYRLTGLGTGLSICAKPMVVPVDEDSKLLVSIQYMLVFFVVMVRCDLLQQKVP